MMGQLLKQATQLRKVLFDMEVELGISRLSGPEKAVLFAIQEITAAGQGAAMNQIIAHPFVGEISAPTVFRAIASLKEAGLVAKEPGHKGLYTPTV